VDKNLLRRQTETVLSSLRRKNACVGIWLASDRSVRRLNGIYRGKWRSTDVLSFRSEIKGDLGDIVVGVPFVNRRAQRYQTSFSQLLPVVVTHGLCHLCGFDHDSDRNFESMHRAEEKALKSLHKAELWADKGLENFYKSYDS